MNVRFHSLAEHELREAEQYIEAHRTHWGAKFRDRVDGGFALRSLKARALRTELWSVVLFGQGRSLSVLHLLRMGG